AKIASTIAGTPKSVRGSTPASSRRTSRTRPSVSKYRRTNSSPAYEVSPVRPNRSFRFPLTRPRKSALLHRIGNGLSLRVDSLVSQPRIYHNGRPSHSLRPAASIFLSHRG